MDKIRFSVRGEQLSIHLVYVTNWKRNKTYTALEVFIKPTSKKAQEELKLHVAIFTVVRKELPLAYLSLEHSNGPHAPSAEQSEISKCTEHSIGT